MFKELTINFKVLEIPKGSKKYTTLSSDIIEIFKKYGVLLNPNKEGRVSFIKRLNFNQKALLNALKKLYEDSYANYNIDIKEIDLEPTAATDIAGYTLHEIDINDNTIKRDSGTFVAIYKNSASKVKKVFFRFSIDAQIDFIEASKRVEMGERVSAFNTEIKRGKFEFMSSPFINRDDLGKFESRRYLQKGSKIRKRDLKIASLIKKGSKVVATYSDGLVTLEMEVEALGDGNVGDYIMVKNGEGKRFKAQIISKGSVSIR